MRWQFQVHPRPLHSRVIFQMGNYWFRFPFSIPALLRKKYFVTVEATEGRSRGDVRFANVFVDFVCSNMKLDIREDGKARGDNTARDRVRASLDFLFHRLWTGGYRSRRVIHHCSGGACVCGFKFCLLLHLFLGAFNNTLFALCMPRAEIGKCLQLHNV